MPQGMRTYWTFWVDIAVIYGVILTGRHVVIPETLQKQALEQIHVNHMWIRKTMLLACKSIYWTGMNNDTENCIKIALHVLIFSKHSQKKVIHHEVPGKPWQVDWTDMFTVHNKQYLCIVDYHSKFPVIKKMESLSGDSLIVACKIMFPDMVYQRK